MRFQNILFILVISIVITGCGACESSSYPVNPANTNPKSAGSPDSSKSPEAKINEDKGNTNSDFPTEPPLAASKEGKNVEAITLKPLIVAYCEAMRNGDNVGLEKVFSSASVREMKAQMKNEGISTLAEYLESEPVGNKCQVVNEEITGNSATAEVITETYEDGVTYKFIKENNEWKMTNESEEFDRVDQSK